METKDACITPVQGSKFTVALGPCQNPSDWEGLNPGDSISYRFVCSQGGKLVSPQIYHYGIRVRSHLLDATFCTRASAHLRNAMLVTSVPHTILLSVQQLGRRHPFYRGRIPIDLPLRSYGFSYFSLANARLFVSL